MTKTAAALCAALLMLTGCGGGDSGSDGSGGGTSAEDQQAKDNIRASVLDGGGDLAAGQELTEDQADCLADGMVDDIGVAKLQDYGLLTEDLEIDGNAEPTDLSQGDADQLAGVLVDCVDFEKMITDGMSGSGSDLTPEQQECVSGAFDQDAVIALLSDQFQGKQPDTSALMNEDLMACMMGTTGEGELQMP